MEARRLLALVSLLAFVSLLWQIEGLIGNQGILPARDYLKKAQEVLGDSSFWQIPSLFWFFLEDPPLIPLCIVGLIGSILGGLKQTWLARAGFILALVAYVSVVSTGQVFFGYQWDSLLTESLFLFVFFPNDPSANRLQKFWYWAWHLCLRLILVKLLIGSAFVKWASGDPSYQDLTAMNYHYLTQPLPHQLGLYAYHLPDSIHKVSVIWMFAIEGLFPLMLFGFGYTLGTGIFFQVLLQVLILLTGSFGFFNLLTIALILSTWHYKSYTGPVFKTPILPVSAMFCLIFHCLLSVNQLSRQFFKTSSDSLTAVQKQIEPFRIQNSYGLFATMTTSRLEISVETSADCINFKPLTFLYKPDPNTPGIPRWAGFHMPRLDWQMWFTALAPPEHSPWFFRFLESLASGSNPVKNLLAVAPNEPIACFRTPVFETKIDEAAFTFEYLGVFTHTLRVNKDSGPDRL